MAMHLAVLAELTRTNPLARAADRRRRRLPGRPLWALSAGASVWLSDLEPYEKCRVAGVVKRLRVDPHHGYIEVTINDGTGQVPARWTLREPAPQLALTPGTAVVLDGVATVGDEGRLTLLEPGFRTTIYLASD